MIIEQLTFEVEPDHLSDWLAVDAAVWDRLLMTIPGFLGKEVWITDAPSDAGPADRSIVEVQVIVRWSDRASWKSVSDEVLRATHDAMGVHARAPRETVHVTADDRQVGRPGTAPASA